MGLAACYFYIDKTFINIHNQYIVQQNLVNMGYVVLGHQNKIEKSTFNCESIFIFIFILKSKQESFKYGILFIIICYSRDGQLPKYLEIQQDYSPNFQWECCQKIVPTQTLCCGNLYLTFPKLKTQLLEVVIGMCVICSIHS